MLFGRFLTDRKASVTPLLALSVVPIICAVGAAVDYSHGNSAKADMQAALDAATMFLSTSASTLSATQIQQNAQNVFLANFHRTDVSNVQVTANYAQAHGSTLTITGSATVQTNFLGAMGISSLNIATSSTATWGTTRLRVALVLDNTGSMAQSGKMTALKTASHNLLTQLQTAAQTPEDVYVSIIPFGKDVNVGPGNYSASWIDWTEWDAANGSNVANGQTCTGTGNHRQCTTNYVWTPADHATWNGCVTDRTQSFDTLNTAPTTGSTLFPAEQYSSCPAALTPMTNNWTTLSSAIDAMRPNGNTNQAIGVAWGWQSLSQIAPLNAPALDPNYTYEQVIILLSDGLNTQDRWYSNASSIDARQQLACDNAKAAGITVYTVLVMSGDSAILQNCASDATKYFALTTSGQIVSTFNQIGTALSQLRISQ